MFWQLCKKSASYISGAEEEEIKDVHCGDHMSDHCSKCPFDSNSTFLGKAWCKGDCKWVGGNSLYVVSAQVNLKEFVP